MRISDLPASDHPAHRARTMGVDALSTSELLALVLGLSGTESAAALLALGDGALRRLAILPAARYAAVPHVGRRKAMALHAVFELARRWAAESRELGSPIRSPRDVVACYGPRLEDLTAEEFHVAILDTQRRLERDVTVSRGTLNSSLVHPREVFREAIAERAAGIVVIHNHPSGDPTPSADDRSITEQLVAAGRLLDIPVFDHVIIGRGRYTSFAEAGLL